MNFWFKLLFKVRHKALSKVANASVCPSLIKGMDGHASIDITTRYIKPNQQAIDAAVRAKHGSPSKIQAPALAPRAPSPGLAPAPPASAPAPAPAPLAPAPASPAEESQAPAPLLDESPLLSIQHSFGDHSKDSVSSDFAAGALGLTTQQFEVPKESLSAFPSNISLGTGEELSPPHYKDRGRFAEDCPRNEDYRPHEPQCEDRSRLQYEHYNWYEPLYQGEPPPPTPHTQSYEPRYEEHKPPPPNPRRVSFGENWSYYEPQYEEPRPLSYQPRYKEHEQRKPPLRQSYEPQDEEECKPPPHQSYKSRYKEQERKPPPRQSYEPQYKEQRPSLAERGSHARPPPRQARPPPQAPPHVSFGENHYHCYDEQNGAWGPSPVEVFSHSAYPSGKPSFASTDPEAQVTSPVVHRGGQITVPGRVPCEEPAWDQHIHF
eukprot:jgi/Psemu1/40499/gm1.40499_g